MYALHTAVNTKENWQMRRTCVGHQMLKLSGESMGNTYECIHNTQNLLDLSLPAQKFAAL